MLNGLSFGVELTDCLSAWVWVFLGLVSGGGGLLGVGLVSGGGERWRAFSGIWCLWWIVMVSTFLWWWVARCGFGKWWW